MKALATGITIMNETDGMAVSPISHECPSCGGKHPCEVSGIFNSAHKDEHGVRCVTGYKRVGWSVRGGPSGNDLVFTADPGCDITEYRTWADHSDDTEFFPSLEERIAAQKNWDDNYADTGYCTHCGREG